MREEAAKNLNKDWDLVIEPGRADHILPHAIVVDRPGDGHSRARVVVGAPRRAVIDIAALV